MLPTAFDRTREESSVLVEAPNGLTVRQLACSCIAILACASVGASVAAIATARQRMALQALQTTPVSSWEFTIASDATVSSFGYSCTARAATSDVPVAQVTLSSNAAFERGQVVTCVGRFSPLATDDYGTSAWLRGVVGSVRIVRVRSVRDPEGLTGALMRLRSHALKLIEPDRSDSRAFLAGIACGNRSALDSSGLGDVFSACGIAHVVAVSGAHLAIVASLLTSLLMRTNLGPSVRIVILALATGSFVLLCGAPPSAIRAWLMALVSHAAQLLGRRSHALSSLSVVALGMTLVEPNLVGQLGFLLSVSSIVALTIFGRYFSYVLDVLVGHPKLPFWVHRVVRSRIFGALDGSRGMLSATLVCQVATLPLTIASFGSVSLVAPCANILVGPLLGILLAMGLAILCLQALPWLCAIVLLAFDALCTPLLMLLHALARSPASAVAVQIPAPSLAFGVLAIGVVLYAWWPKPSRAVTLRVLSTLAIIALSCTVRWRFLSPARIVVLDVGQGDAILVQDGASALLVDTGPDETISDALARNHVLHLDAVILTHLHDDHYGGLSHLSPAVSCERVMVAEGVTGHMDDELVQSCQGLTGDLPLELSYGDELRVGSFHLRMVWPRAPVEGTTNADSIELLVDYQRGGVSLTALLTGDAEKEETGACIHAGDVGVVDLLKVGHHGSEGSVDNDIAATLHPLVAVASAGEGNEYGHPRKECVDALEAVGARFLCTKDVGDVEVRPSARGLTVRCQR